MILYRKRKSYISIRKYEFKSMSNIYLLFMAMNFIKVSAFKSKYEFINFRSLFSEAETLNHISKI